MDTENPVPEPKSLEALLRENIAVTNENNEILKDMRRIGRIAFWAKVILWTLLLVVPLLFIGSILESFTSMISPSDAQSIMGLPSAEMIKDALEMYSGEGL